MKFTVEVAQGRKMELNSVEAMGQAFTPMELFLVALAGCTAMDIQWIMSRQRQQVDKFEVLVRGTRREKDPRYYEEIDLEYILVGAGIKRNAVERAIRLSQNEYCSVRAMLKDSVKLNISYTIADGGTEQKFAYAG
ncbi:MAG TPA: OsmC family protein [Terriglobales bacterium]|nr:OsmC family protein [Terriglobales bacterium]